LDVACKRGVGRTRSLQRLRRHLQAPVFHQHDTTLIWQWLEPIDAADPTLQQDNISVRAGAAHVSRHHGGDVWAFLVTVLEASDHSLGRLLSREPSVDLSSTLHQAASAVLSADAEQVGDGFNLKVPGGLFLCRAQGYWVDGKYSRYCRCSTFITDQMARPDQRPVIAASDLSNSVLALLAQRAFPDRLVPTFTPPRGNST
jgi:hypothetical protein